MARLAADLASDEQRAANEATLVTMREHRDDFRVFVEPDNMTLTLSEHTAIADAIGAGRRGRRAATDRH